MSNIFSVANKKIRKRDKSKSGGDSVDIELESESYGYSERNIDQVGGNILLFCDL